MGSNIIELAKLGHERAAELKVSCGAVDVRSLAQLISDLATQLEVQFVRSTNMAVQLANAESKCRELAADNSAIKVMNDCLSEELRGYESNGAFDGPKMHLLWWKAETPATDAFLAEVRAQEEIMLRSVSDTSDAWQDEASPEAVLALLDELEAAQHEKDELQQGFIANQEEAHEAIKYATELKEQLARACAGREEAFREVDEMQKSLDHTHRRRSIWRRRAGEAEDKLEAAEKRIAELQIARDKCFKSGLKTGWEYGIADDTEGYNREIADAQAVIDRAAGIGVKGE